MPATPATTVTTVRPRPRAAPRPRAQPAAPNALPRCGVPALDALAPFHPGRLTFLESATPFLHRVVHGLVCDAVARGLEVVWVDGANVVQPHGLARAARAHGLDAEATLEAVRLARGFTAHQLQALIEAHLPREVTAATGLVVAAGLPAMYTDDDVRASEARAMLRRALDALARVARDGDVPVVATHRGMARLHAHPALRRLLHGLPHEVVRLHPAPRGAWAELPRRGRRVHLPDPASAQTVLPRYGVRVEGVA